MYRCSPKELDFIIPPFSLRTAVHLLRGLRNEGTDGQTDRDEGQGQEKRGCCCSRNGLLVFPNNT